MRTCAPKIFLIYKERKDCFQGVLVDIPVSLSILKHAHKVNSICNFHMAIASIEMVQL